MSGVSPDVSVRWPSRNGSIRVIGIDSGRHLGWALLSIEGGVPRFVAGGTVPVISDQNVISVPMQILREVGVPISVVGVELIRGKAHAEGDLKKAAAKSKHLVHASRISGACEMAAHSLGWPVESFPATEWRKALIGNAFASDKTIGAVLRLRVRGIPRSNAHVRDAIGVALFAYLRRKLTAPMQPPTGQRTESGRPPFSR